MEEHKCNEQVYPGHTYMPGGYQCTRKGTVEVYGKWYCWQHDPERVERLQKEAEEKWEHESQASTEKFQRRHLEQDVCAGATDEELESILGVGGLRGMLGIDAERTISIGFRMREADND